MKALTRRLFGRNVVTPKPIRAPDWYRAASLEQLIRDTIDNPDGAEAGRSLDEMLRRQNELIARSYRAAAERAAQASDPEIRR